MAKAETIYFGGGCFWCTEAAFKQVKGVSKVTPGYSGGAYENPTYEDVCTGDTGHAEVIEVLFDPEVVALEKLLDVFFIVHDPTTKDRQGGDVGTQYRSIILYTSNAQAESISEFLSAEKNKHDAPIITEVKKFEKFWPAEGYHQDYFRRNPGQPYCLFVIRPKLKKLEGKLSGGK